MSENDTAKRPKKFRWLIWVPVAVVALLVASALIMASIAKSYVNADFIASQIEGENNCRVEIAETQVSLLSFPARIELKGVKIAKRDDHADAGTKVSDRPPLEGGGVISAESIVLEANLTDILRRKISLEHLTVKKLHVSEFLIEREGGHSLDELFDPPSTVAGNPNPEFEEKKKRRDLAKERRKLAKEERAAEGEATFAISELPLPATMQALNITDANIYAKIRRNKTRITISGLQVQVSDIDLDPGDLKGHNHAKVTITGQQ